MDMSLHHKARLRWMAIAAALGLVVLLWQRPALAMQTRSAETPAVDAASQEAVSADRGASEDPPTPNSAVSTEPSTVENVTAALSPTCRLQPAVPGFPYTYVDWSGLEPSTLGEIVLAQPAQRIPLSTVSGHLQLPIEAAGLVQMEATVGGQSLTVRCGEIPTAVSPGTCHASDVYDDAGNNIIARVLEWSSFPSQAWGFVEIGGNRLDPQPLAESGRINYEGNARGAVSMEYHSPTTAVVRTMCGTFALDALEPACSVSDETGANILAWEGFPLTGVDATISHINDTITAHLAGRGQMTLPARFIEEVIELTFFDDVAGQEITLSCGSLAPPFCNVSMTNNGFLLSWDRIRPLPAMIQIGGVPSGTITTRSGALQLADTAQPTTVRVVLTASGGAGRECGSTSITLKGDCRIEVDKLGQSKLRWWGVPPGAEAHRTVYKYFGTFVGRYVPVGPMLPNQGLIPLTPSDVREQVIHLRNAAGWELLLFCGVYDSSPTAHAQVDRSPSEGTSP